MNKIEEYKLQGWVARDECSGDESNLRLGRQKPRRIQDTIEGSGAWCNYGEYMELPADMFPRLTYKDEPVEVEIIIKKKEKYGNNIRLSDTTDKT